jgi:hypothetical protein
VVLAEGDVFQKLGAASRIGAVLWAKNEGLFSDGPAAGDWFFLQCLVASAGYLWKSTVDKRRCFWYTEDGAKNPVTILITGS